ncbi:zinc knuckle transcription factor (CnjB) [Penicillium waksmanii]|uniref:zinc knuckle transcription factor (CnjB) n=1 Tax=Penicillium waksmanii TaxID=69791 RepID=UPI002548B6B5|nr:zinc knuckle transcription factor (CnjB) [Penicillium waksmanii]KAJ5976062.1 zinc knuckle transcription factor (CnjB) [Penicillium waksmanii]
MSGRGQQYEEGEEDQGFKTIHGNFQDGKTCRNCGEPDHFARNCPDNNGGGGGGGGGGGRACFNCGEEGHNKSDCPQPRKSMGACYNCGEEGHSKNDCPRPRKSMGACYNCGEEGHSKNDCPQPRKAMGVCYNCGEVGHNKSDCLQPRIFKGTCRICNQEGHPAATCPEKPVNICRNCKAEGERSPSRLPTYLKTKNVYICVTGHQSKDCKANRKFDLNQVADKLPEEAWAMMKGASEEKEIGEFRDALQIYAKACPDETFQTIGKKMRDESFKISLIALEKPTEDVISLIDLQGKLDRQYVVGFFYSDKPQRANLRERWPETPEDNLERLQNAGLPYDRQVMKCRNCGEMGHSARACKQEPVAFEKTEIKCNNCGELGHRVRDCTQPRKSRFGCRNCGSEEHEARECPEPRSADDVECRRCNEKGHFAKDCPNSAPREPRTCRNCGSTEHIARECDQPANPDNMICRNCDGKGHAARDCPEPKNWSKVKCNRCSNMGHTVRRCPEPEPEANEAPDNHENEGESRQDYQALDNHGYGELREDNNGGGYDEEGGRW